MEKKKTVGIKIGLGIIGLLLAACGILCFVNPQGTVDTVFKIIGVVLIVIGVGSAVYFFAYGKYMVFSGSILGNGVLDILLGAVFLNYSGQATTVITVLYGILLIATGFLALLATGVVRKLSESKAWIGVLVFAAVAIILGVVALTKQEVGTTLLTIPVGLGLIAIGAGYLFVDVQLIRAGSNRSELGKFYRDVPDDDAVDADFTDVSD